MSKRYSVATSNKNKVITEFSIDSLSGLSVKPKNQIDEALKVTEAKIINPDFINNILKKRNEKKIESFLKYLLVALNDEDDDSDENISIVLDDLERFRRQLINKQAKYLKAAYLKKMLEKTIIIESELKKKIIYKQPLEETRKKGR